ncbi:MAG: hypothetical protein L6Q47_12130 [Ignavibacteriaceae bacterium]|nr:hypothetical protein [Ignavibacteriaceae bacterium]
MFHLTTFNLHVSKDSREKFGFESTLFSVTGNLIIADFTAARELSDRINKLGKPGTFVTPGLINTAGLFHEVLHLVIRKYEENENPGVFERGVKYLEDKLQENAGLIFQKFIEHFPPLPVYLNEVTPEEYLAGSTAGKPNREIILEEILLLYLENENPGFNALSELFDDASLKEIPVYETFLKETEQFFDSEKPASIENLPLLKALKKPILENPTDILAQLNYISFKWRVVLSDLLVFKLLSGSDLIREDAKLFISHGGVGTPPVPEYSKALQEYLEELKAMMKAGGGKLTPEEWAALQKKFSIDDISFSYMQETEQFTEDLDWMPNVVMIAKNTLVWLDQLSKKYGREINRLDQIPDQEIDQLAAWNINTLWFIGIWERSTASKKIKQFCGNPDATSSAYSLYSYEIAQAVGGEEAFNQFKQRCAARGIRLASDMVPNHTGIYSDWVLKHPEYFIQRVSPPYPSYSFTGPDLSENPAMQIRIEDKYYTRQDAAVVFQVIENATGLTRYIYHGNDGTNMPWNDTAQLNLLLPEVREALIQNIMHVARMTPVIRFDAAMTLAKKHYSRLWFPQPGSGGAVPSRAEYAMSPDMFNQAMPNEFWREVVDRMNAEMPNTLLLAEAFWLMEGYFVRTLGMHRVYNSAFMHMFMKEENDKYRLLIKNTLEFNPEILKRYVNFMSNPDEETAVNQFGKGDKYFGVLVMMATLPGLPMFAHGQIEGFTEKYGMEYSRAYYNEQADEYLVRRHEREIFPLLKKRALFAEVENFELYDFLNEEDEPEESVIAFSNGRGSERTVVVYNNSYAAVKGYINHSSGKVTGDKHEDETAEFRSLPVASALKINSQPDIYYIYFESRSGLEYITSAAEIVSGGMHFRLNGYEYKVLLNFAEVRDVNGKYRRLAAMLNGSGVPSIETAMREMELMPLHTAVNNLFTREVIAVLQDSLTAEPDTAYTLPEKAERLLTPVVRELSLFLNKPVQQEAVIGQVADDLYRLKEYRFTITPSEKLGMRNVKLQDYTIRLESGAGYYDLLLIYTITRRLLLVFQEKESGRNAGALYDLLILAKPLWQNFIRLSDNYRVIKDEFELLRIFSTAQSIFPRYSRLIKSGTAAGKIYISSMQDRVLLLELMIRPEIREFLNFNTWQGVVYFSKERFELLLKWMFTIEHLRRIEWLRADASPKETTAKFMKSKDFTESTLQMIDYISALLGTAGESGFNFDLFREKVLVKESAPAAAKNPAARKSTAKRAEPAGEVAKEEKKKPSKVKKAAGEKKSLAEEKSADVKKKEKPEKKKSEKKAKKEKKSDSGKKKEKKKEKKSSSEKKGKKSSEKKKKS